MATTERERRRAQLLRVSAEVFAEKGYHDARIDDVVARAKVARGTFYLYFEDKRAVFEELVTSFVARLSDDITTVVLDGDHARAMGELRENLLRVVRRFMAEPLMARILLSAAVGLDKDFDQRLLAFYDEITALLERSLEQAEGAGLVRPGQRRVRSYCLVGIIKELLYQLVLRGAEEPPELLVDAMLDLVAEGIFTDVARGAIHRG